jgi:SAM-dependent methyltransferase
MTAQRRDHDIDRYYATLGEAGLYAHTGSLRFRLELLYDGLDFRDKTVLDIGGGSGIHSFFAAFKGARRVVCLEPVGAGSSSVARARFRRLSDLFELDNVLLKETTLQAFEGAGERFDIVLLHNSINHLDEAACMELPEGHAARATYSSLFAKIAELANSGAALIITDCSRYNAFALLRIRNPFAPTIRWQLHHAPEVWASLARDAGFVNPDIRWSSFSRLRWLGRLLLANRVAAYFFKSHFVLTMVKP